MANNKSLQKSNPYLVVQDNEFINFRHTLSLQEARVFLSLIAEIDKEDEDFKDYKISVEHFAESAGLNKTGVYNSLKLVSEELMKKTFKKLEEDGSFLLVSYISSAKYKAGEAYVTVSFDPKLKPYLLGLKSKFTQYDVRNILALRSIFSILLYQQLKQFEKIGERTYNLIDLKYKLNVDDKFKNYNDFKRYVIEKAKKEIEDNCDIYFEYEEIKEVRKVVSIKFYIYSQTPLRTKIKKLTEPKPKPQDEPSHISNLVQDVPFVEIPQAQAQAQPQSITTPPPTGSSVPSMATIQALGEKLKLTIEQVNEIMTHYNHDSVRVWEVLQATTKQEGVKNAMAYIMGSHGLGAGLWNEQQKKLKQAQEKELKRLLSTIQEEYQSRKQAQFRKLYEQADDSLRNAVYKVIAEDTKQIINGRHLQINQDTKELNNFGIQEAGKLIAEFKEIGTATRQAKFRNEIFDRYKIQINFDKDDKIIF